MPVMGGGHGDTGVDALHLGNDQAAGPIPSGDHTPGQEHMASQLSPAPVKDLGPQDDLHVPGFIFDCDEHRAVLSLGVLPGDGPARHQYLLSLTRILHGSGGQHPRITRPFHSLDMISSPVWLDIKVVNKNSTEFLRYDRNWFLMVPVPVKGS